MRWKKSIVIALVFIIFCIIFILLHHAINETYTPKFRYIPKDAQRQKSIKISKTEPQAPEIVRMMGDTSNAPIAYDILYNNIIARPSTLENELENTNLEYQWEEIEIEQIFDDFSSQISAPSLKVENTQQMIAVDHLSPTQITQGTTKVTTTTTTSTGHPFPQVPIPDSDLLVRELQILASEIVTPSTTEATSTTTQQLLQQISISDALPSNEAQMSEQSSALVTPLVPSFDNFYKEPIPHIPIKPTASDHDFLKFSENTTVNTYNCCNPNTTYPYHKNIIFIKVHKCASSTVQNILMRFGLRNNLNFILPYFFYITYYEPYKADFIPPEIRTPDGKYNILTHHVRYWPSLKNSMYPDALSVTILRSPASVFEGMYNYFLLNYVLGKSFQEFLKSPQDMQSPVKDTMPVYRGYNQMSMDLGLDKIYFENQTAIKSFIEFIDKEFDFVMIVEYFDESLVLLAHLMGWPLNHVAYIPVNRRHQGVKYYLTESDREVLSGLNQADTMLYNHFLKKFQKCRQQFGIDRLQNEVKKLHELNNALREKCVFAEHIVPIIGIVGYDTKNFTDWECIYSTKYEYFFTEELKFRQSQRMLLNRTAHW